jgi:hypothetical protein
MKIGSVVFFVLLTIPFCSAAHYIIGIVNDARDSTPANGQTILFWNPVNGILDNLTDIIGINGNSGADNIYMIDCEMLGAPCDVGDMINAQIPNDGDNYISEIINLTVTGVGFDIMENLTLNSPPEAYLNYPINGDNLSLESVDFNCSFADLDFNVHNVTLYGNWGDGWHANETQTVTGNSSVVFSKSLIEGRYAWNCLVSDNLGASSFSNENFTFTLDRSGPTITSVYFNESYFCGAKTVRVNCTVADNLTQVGQVIIEAIMPGGMQNYSTSILYGDTYYSDILVNGSGDWFFNCIANDTLGNTANLTSQILSLPMGLSDLSISWINFSNYFPLENQEIIVNASVTNNGCSNANNFLVGFYNGNPDSGGVQINNNRTISISALSNMTVNVTWNAEIGNTNFFVIVDFNNSINESNESNNLANKSLNVGAWQEFYGNITLDKILSKNSFMNLSSWINESYFEGNIFIADLESNIQWGSLQSIGKNISDQAVSNDFLDIDSILGMGSFSDSVSSSFGSCSYSSLLVKQRNITDVPLVNSTINSNFLTGILWDMADDRGDGEFSMADREDLVFVAKTNKGKHGAYGIYDYEIKIPVRLREYNTFDTSEVYLYYDLT